MPTRLPIAPALLLAALLAAGCGPKTADQPNRFFEEWKELAERSQGHSPAAETRGPEITHIREVAGPAVQDQAARRPLPRNLVSMRLNDVETPVLLRALAKAAGRSLLISDGVSGRLSLDARDLPWDQVFLGVLKNQGLSWVWEGELIRVVSAEDMKKELEVASIQSEQLQKANQAGHRAPLATSVVGIKFADAKELAKELAAFLTPGPDGKARGSVAVDEHNNAIIVQANADDGQRIIRLIDSLDRPRAQVQLKAHIVEATSDTARDLGIQWGGFFQSGKIDGQGNRAFATPGAITGPDGTTAPLTGPESFNRFGVNLPAELADGKGTQLGLLYGKLGESILEMQLSALQEDGKVNILSSPSITTLDNQTAFTENGERVPFVATDPEGDLEVKFEDAVLRLEITPHVIDRGTLKLRVLVKKDEVDDSRNVLGNPFIIKKQTETNLIVADGETVVISGLSRRRSFDRSQGVPELEKLPGVGNLFRRDNKGEQLEDVLIFITPRILPQRAGQAGNASPAG